MTGVCNLKSFCYSSVSRGSLNPGYVQIYNNEGRCFSIWKGVSQFRLSEMVEDFAAEASLRDLIA
jgi:hypothetical protein